MRINEFGPNVFINHPSALSPETPATIHQIFRGFSDVLRSTILSIVG